MEHWVWKVECMKRISTHIESGESLSEEICEKLNKSKNIGVSLLTLRQVSFGLADQHLHGENFKGCGGLSYTGTLLGYAPTWSPLGIYS